MARHMIAFARNTLIAVAMAAAAGPALAQASDANALRASGKVGEQADGYLGFVNGQIDAALKSRVDQVNIQRRALFTQQAERSGVTVAEIGATTACQQLASKVEPGQSWRDENGAWRTRDSGPVPLPSFCPR